MPISVVLLPAYNEQAAIGPLLDRIQSTLKVGSFRVLVVDDGSTDRTAEIARDKAKTMPVEVLVRHKNGGLGAALSDGFEHAANTYSDSDLLITMDADNTFDPALIPEMEKSIEAGADLVIASRHVKGARVIGVPLLRKFLSFGIGTILKIVFHPKNIRDFTSGYRCFRMSLIKQACKRFNPLIRSRGFAATMEILMKALAEDPVCQELPFTLRYDLKPGRSKLRVWHTIFEYCRAIVICRQDIRNTQK